MNQTEFEKNYPGYCRKCKGWGMCKSLSPNIQILDCECFKEGHCPRCGENQLDTLRICSNCGWNPDDANRGLPGSRVI